MIDNINEAEIKNILRNRTKMIENIHKKMFSLYRELETTDDVLEAVALPTVKTDGMPGAKGTHKDLSDVLLSYRRQLYDRNEEIRRIMYELVSQEEKVSRVWACFLALDDPYYSMLYEIYVENQLYQSVEASFDMSHKTFEKKRQHGISLIEKFYKSGASVTDLMQRHQNENASKKKSIVKNPPEDNGYNQISFKGYLSGNMAKEGEDAKC